MALGSYFDGGSDFVLERFSPDGLTTFAGTGGVTGLDHKGSDVAMKNATIVIVGGTKGKKVLEQQDECERLKHTRMYIGEESAEVDIPLLPWAQPRRRPRP